MPPRRAARSGRGSGAGEGPSWRTVEPAPVVLLSGPEEYFAAQARRRILGHVRAAAQAQGGSGPEVHELSAKDYAPGSLAAACSPSLFGDSRVVLIEGLEKMAEEFLQEAMAYLAAPEPEAVVVMTHAGGNRGRKLVDAVGAAGFPVVACRALKTDREKTEFVHEAFRAENRRIEPDAARLLIAAAGRDTAELASACRQLLQDGPAVVTDVVVERYYGGRAEVTAFKVADAAVSGHSGPALRALRQALGSGVDPVPLVGALATRVRHIAQVHGSREPAARLAQSLGMAPWQVEQAQREARRFSSEALAAAIRSLAEADVQVKGGAQDPVYALERAVLDLSLAGRRR